MFWRGIHKFSNIEVAPGGASYGFGNYNTLGRTYFVNNITGKETADGRRWDRAVAQPQQAIDLAATYLSEHETNNQWIRNTIVIQGTETAYENVTACPTLCDMIGLGTPHGAGSWGSVPRIWGHEVAAMAGDTRGMGLYNLRFEVDGGGSYNIFTIPNSLGMHMEDCALMSHEDNDTELLHAAIGGTVTVWAGHYIVNNRIGGAGGGYGCNIGIDLAQGHATTWNNCWIKGNIIEGTAYGIKGNPIANAQGSLITRNDIFAQTTGAEGGPLTVVGIVMSKFAHSSGNYISAAAGLSEHENSQSVGNDIVTT